MRIAFIAGEYPPMQGGLGDFTREVARACAQAGHEAHVITQHVQDASALEHVDGISVHRLVTAWNWETRRRLEGFVRVHAPDVLNLQYQAAAYQMHPAINFLPAGLSRRTPTVVTFHDLRAPYLFPKAGAFRWKVLAKMARDSSGVIVTNVEDCDLLAAEGVNSDVVPIGSNIAPASLAAYDRVAWCRVRGIAESTTLVGYFGFMNDSKGGETLVRALGQLRAVGRDVSVLLIGGQTGASDPTNVAYAERLTKLSETLGVRPHIYQTGFLDSRGVSEAFAACACMALPYRDGVSFRRGTLMAALAHAMVVVTTTPRVRLSQVRHNENMLLVPPDDPGALSAAIIRVLDDGELRARLKAGATQLSELFQWDRIALDTVQVFERVIQESTASSRSGSPR